MIRVRCLGHIKTSLGAEEIELSADDLETGELVDKLRSMSKEQDPGFNKFNTLALIEDGEAFVPASTKRMVKSGERVVLIPFSHGG
jgi:molybdopterin converting factor small subunit